MLDDLLPFYERELSALRALTAAFADRYPKVAGRLQIDSDPCEDPQVERLLQAFAWMGARIHRRLDDQVPEIAESLLEVLCPLFTRPVPSATILQVVPDPHASTPDKHAIPRHTLALAPEVQGTRCPFRTCYDLDLWPLSVVRAGLEAVPAPPGQAATALTLDLCTRFGIPFAALKVDRLRFFLDGEPRLAHLLHQLLCFRLQGVQVGPPGQRSKGGTLLPATCVRPVGFSPDESLYPQDSPSFPGHRLLFEFFTFPDKFLFFEITGLDDPRLDLAGPELRLRFLVAFGAGEGPPRFLEGLGPDHFKLGCVPAVNQFAQTAAPIRVTAGRSGFPLTVPGRAPAEWEALAIESVHLTLPDTPEAAPQAVPPYHALRHGDPRAHAGLAWRATRQLAAAPGQAGTDLELALVDPTFLPVQPDGATLEVQLTCSNRNLPTALPPGQDGFLLPRHNAVVGARTLRRPSPSLAPPARPERLWPTLAHLGMNELTLAALSPAALRAMLQCYVCPGSSTATDASQGILAVETRTASAVLTGRGQARLARGVELRLTLDEACFSTGNLHLFASVLERFLAQICPQTRFVQLRLFFGRDPERERLQWPPRPGAAALV